MKKLIFIAFLLYSTNAFAETYAVQKSNGIAIVYYFENSQDSLFDVLKSFGLDGLPVVKVDSLPPNKSDREFWVISGRNIVVDQAKKQAAIDAKAARDAEADAVLQKLKISKVEAAKLKEVIYGK
jgi:hypothetical protein